MDISKAAVIPRLIFGDVWPDISWSFLSFTYTHTIADRAGFAVSRFQCATKRKQLTMYVSIICQLFWRVLVSKRVVLLTISQIEFCLYSDLSTLPPLRQQKFCQVQSCIFKAPNWVNAEANNEPFDRNDVFKLRHHSTITVGVPALISFVLFLVILGPPAAFF